MLCTYLENVLLQRQSGSLVVLRGSSKSRDKSQVSVAAGNHLVT